MTRAQDQLLELVASGARIEEARRRLGITTSQLARWIAGDAVFRTALATAADVGP